MSEAGDILVFGRSGQIAKALAVLCRETGLGARFLGRDEADLRMPEQIEAAVVAGPWCAAINAAAYTAVDRAEDEPDLANDVNAAAPAVIAAACRAANIPLLHLSTNFVFDGGAPEPYAEDAPARPQSVYGRTKLAGERAVRAALPEHVILRTGWVFAADGVNFPRGVLAAAEGTTELAMVSDQWGDPTPARAIAAALVDFADRIVRGRPAPFGTYHFAGAPSVTRLGFAEAVFDASRRAGADSLPRLVPVATADFPARAPRPLNGRLDCRKIERVLGLARPDWRLALDEAVRHMLAPAPARDARGRA